MLIASKIGMSSSSDSLPTENLYAWFDAMSIDGTSSMVLNSNNDSSIVATANTETSFDKGIVLTGSNNLKITKNNSASTFTAGFGNNYTIALSFYLRSSSDIRQYSGLFGGHPYSPGLVGFSSGSDSNLGIYDMSYYYNPSGWSSDYIITITSNQLIGHWNYVCVVCESNRIRGFLNGNKIKDTVVTGNANMFNISNMTEFCIGNPHRSASYDRNFIGKIGDFIVWNTGLSDGLCQQIYRYQKRVYK